METRLIYGLTVEGRIMYVGQTKDIWRRFNEHIRTAKAPKSARAVGQKKLYEALAACLKADPGAASLDAVELEKCRAKDSNVRERHWIRLLGMHETGWNTPLPGGPGREKGCSNPSGPAHYLYGKRLPKKTIDKIRATRTGMKFGKEHGEKIRLGKIRNGTLNASQKVVIRDDGKKYESLTRAATELGCSISAITLAIKKQCRCKGHYWSYEKIGS
jgi:hypothetical protein